MITKKLTIDFEKAKELLLEQGNLNDTDYKIYKTFINKYYCNAFYKLLIKDIKTTTNELFDSLHLKYDVIEDKNNLLTYFIISFNGKIIKENQLDSVLLTEKLLFKKISNNVLSLNLDEVMKSIINELKTLFVKSKEIFFKNLENTKELTTEYLLANLLVYLFSYESIGIEREANENRN